MRNQHQARIANMPDGNTYLNVDFPKYFPSCVVLLVDIVAGAGAVPELGTGPANDTSPAEVPVFNSTQGKVQSRAASHNANHPTW